MIMTTKGDAVLCGEARVERGTHEAPGGALRGRGGEGGHNGANPIVEVLLALQARAWPGVRAGLWARAL